MQLVPGIHEEQMEKEALAPLALAFGALNAYFTIGGLWRAGKGIKQLTEGNTEGFSNMIWGAGEAALGTVGGSTIGVPLRKGVAWAASKLGPGVAKSVAKFGARKAPSMFQASKEMMSAERAAAKAAGKTWTKPKPKTWGDIGTSVGGEAGSLGAFSLIPEEGASEGSAAPMPQLSAMTPTQNSLSNNMPTLGSNSYGQPFQSTPKMQPMQFGMPSGFQSQGEQ